VQSLIAPPRNTFTIQQMIDLLQAPDFQMTAGIELLDMFDNFVADISDDLSTDGYITHDSNAVLQSTLSCNLSQELVWGRDRLRPYVVCSSHLLGISDARFNLGIFIATSPTRSLGEYDAAEGVEISSWAVTGWDKLFILNQPVGDSVIAGQGANVLLQVTNLINAATNNDPKISLDGTMGSALLAADKVWPASASSSSTTYLSIINELLAAINYIPLWVDQDGYFRSGPYIDPATATPEWTFNVQDAERNIIADPRSVTKDTWGVPNWWRFVQNGLSAAPAEGAGQFTYVDNSDTETGFATRGYYVRKIVAVDAVDQTTLQLIGQQQIIADTAKPETWSTPSGPLPHSGHFDIVNYIDYDIDGGITSRKCQVQSWTFHFDGSNMERIMTTALVVTS
jgi:hypothetical protein